MGFGEWVLGEVVWVGGGRSEMGTVGCCLGEGKMGGGGAVFWGLGELGVIFSTSSL